MKIDYDKLAPADSLGGRPLSLAAMMRLVESDLHKYRKLEQQGVKETLPTLANGVDDEKTKSIHQRVIELERMKKEFEESIAWLDNIEPGLSRKPGSSLIYTKLREAEGHSN